MQYASCLVTGLALLGHVNAAAMIRRQNPEQNLTISTIDTDNGFNVTDTDDKLKIFTSYLYNQCSDPQKKALKQAVEDANEIAFAGIKRLARPGAAPLDWIDFSTEPAIDYFGPQSKNGDEQRKIFTTLSRSSYAFPGRGWSDWWSNRYVQLNCNATVVPACASGKVVAATSNGNKDFKYPLITFCPIYFTKLPSFSDAIKTLESSNDPARKNNVLNLRNQGSTMLHEWIHMNWGSAEVCPGGAIDNYMFFGPQPQERAKAYKAGRAKLLASRNVAAPANNNDNYVYYSLAWWMGRRYGTFPQYPSAWDPTKSVADNQAAEAKQPGNPPPIQELDALEDDADDGDNGQTINDPLYKASDYPDWYRPVVGAVLPTTSPVTLPVITPPPQATSPPAGAVTKTIDDPPVTTSSLPSATASPTGTPCEGNQIVGNCVQGHLPSTGPNGGPQPPVCNKVGTATEVRISDSKAKDAVTQYCQNLINGKVILNAQNTSPKPGTVAGAAENGGQLSLTVLFDVDVCNANTAAGDQKVDFGKMSLNDCFTNLYTNLAMTCAQDSTWGDYNKDFPLEGGVYGYNCALWAMSGNKV